MKRLLILIIIIITTNNIIAQFYNCSDYYKEKTEFHNYSKKDTQEVNKVNLYLPLMDFRFYKNNHCYYAFDRRGYIYFEDRSRDSCIISKPALVKISCNPYLLTLKKS